MAENFDLMLKENSVYGRCKTSPEQWALFVACGMFLAWMPTYIYASPMFDLGFRESATQFVVVGTGAGTLLAWAYRSVSQKRRIQLLSQSAVPSSSSASNKKEKEEAQLQLEKETAKVCCAYALYVVNASFLVSWLLVAFYVIPKMSTGNVSSALNHVIAVLGPAALLAFRAIAIF